MNRHDAGFEATPEHPVRILLVEDNPGDAVFVATGLERIKTPTRLRVAKDGEEAMACLSGTTNFPEDLQDLILLDLNLPGMSGLEVLERIRGDTRLAHLRVVILTSSSDPRDQQAARDLHADDYLIKPASLCELFELIERLEQRWLTQKNANANGNLIKFRFS
jgi:chemotaxis family two-component system response regulator Rcp1